MIGVSYFGLDKVSLYAQNLKSLDPQSFQSPLVPTLPPRFVLNYINKIYALFVNSEGFQSCLSKPYSVQECVFCPLQTRYVLLFFRSYVKLSSQSLLVCS